VNWLLGLTLVSLVIMGHLQTGSPEAAFDVEALVGFAAVQDALVAADLLGDEIEGLDNAQTEFLALLILCYGDILDVPNETKAMNELPLDY